MRARDDVMATVADAIVGELPGGSFAATIVGDEVRRGKPHPEPYLAAARALSVSPRVRGRWRIHRRVCAALLQRAAM